MKANQEKMEAKVQTNNGKFEILWGTLVPWIDIHQARIEVIQEGIIAKMDAHQERMEASMNAWQKETLACQEAKEAC
jgi:hypothetical protein